MARAGRERETESGADAPASRQRLDKWLWFARIVKSRTLAARLVSEGHVRINGARVAIPAKAVSTGDVLTVSLERDVKVLKIVSGGMRRGPYEEARLLYEDLSGPPPERPSRSDHAFRDPGSGRPTKRDRRSLSAWLHRS